MPSRWPSSSPAVATLNNRIFAFSCFLLCLLITLASSTNADAEAQQTASSLWVADVGERRLAASSKPRLALQLDDFILADFAILSGLDGSLTAIDRANGQTRWTLGSRDPLSGHSGSDSRSIPLSTALTPLVGSYYGKRQISLASMLAGPSDEEKSDAAKHFPPMESLPSRMRHLLGSAGMYVVEPGSSGRLYLLTAPEETELDYRHRRARLQRLPLTLPQLVGLSPFSFPGDKGRVFTGSKRTRLLRIDVFTGHLDRSWEADGAEFGPSADCADDSGDGRRWIYLARTDYTLSISMPRRARLSQTLHYSVYSHQSSDGEVAARWLNRHRGSQATAGEIILPVDLDRDGRGSAKVSGWNVSATGTVHAWTTQVESQVVDVFDILLPRLHPGSFAPTHPVIVPHPPFAISTDDSPNGATDDSRSGPLRDVHDEQDEIDVDETVLTLSPETGSLYALSCRRFSGLLKDVRPALAGLDEKARSSLALVPSNSATQHDPMYCQTFGCWVGRYRVEDENRSPFGGMARLGIGPGRASDAPLEIADQAANPESTGARPSTARPREDIGSKSLLAQLQTLISRPSGKVIATLFLAIAILAGLNILVRKGTREQNRLEAARSHVIVEGHDLHWAGSSGPAEQTDPPQTLLPTESALQASGQPLEATFALGLHAAGDASFAHKLLPEKTVEERRCEADDVAAVILAEEKGAKKNEETEGRLATPTKKKRRRRGKRAGAAVRTRQEQGLDDEDSASEDEKDGAQKAVMRNGSARNGAAAGAVVKDREQSSVLGEGSIQADSDGKSITDQAALLAAVSTSTKAVVSSQSAGSGALELTDDILGYGSSGTVVFKGRFQSRLVAVKRLLVDFVHLASQEISLLESADDHPNVIRYFYKEQVGNFLFIALELCPASLGDLVEKPDEWKDLAVKLDPKKAIAQIASGLRHLHSLSIVHRDIKPQNILVAYTNPHSPSTSSLKMLLSDFGLSKRLDSIVQSSFSQTMHHPGGTAGWRAPEILRGEVSLDDGSNSSSSLNSSLSASRIGGAAVSGPKRERMRLTRAVDIFALGCLSYYVLTSGDHPFGARYEREINIMRGQANLTRLTVFGEEGFEASHLILSMIQPEPTLRPRAITVLSHPYFWDAAKRLAFLQDVSDRLEVIEREKDLTASVSGAGPAATPAVSYAVGSATTEAESELLHRLESRAKDVTAGGDWTKKVEKAFMDDLGKWRKYSGGSVRDLLRALRNKKHHFQDMSPVLRRSMGPMPEGFLGYFTRRFPKLFLHVYEVISENHFIRMETTLKNYFAAQDLE